MSMSAQRWARYRHARAPRGAQHIKKSEQPPPGATEACGGTKAILSGSHRQLTRLKMRPLLLAQQFHQHQYALFRGHGDQSVQAGEGAFRDDDRLAGLKTAGFLKTGSVLPLFKNLDPARGLRLHHRQLLPESDHVGDAHRRTSCLPGARDCDVSSKVTVVQRYRS